MSKLSLCPDSPNCVCTLANETPKKRMEPLQYAGNMSEAKEKLRQLVLALGNTTEENQTENYLYFSFKTRIGGFIDDVEFEFADDKKVIHFRSASRVGYSDLGANKRRMKKIRRLWEKS